MPAPTAVIELVERFDSHGAHYRSAEYKEDHLRQEFLNPLFEELGWDMANREGNAPQYRDVIHEDAIEIGGHNKAPDYCFRIGGTRKFFLEAKKPSVALKNNPDPAYQLRRYAWSAALPVSILTNFAEFAVYDCRKKPTHLDKASVGRTNYYTHDQYVAHWDEIAGIFSKNAILKGSFDKYAESTKGKRGTATVDGAFLAEIEGWREELAKNLAARNPGLEQRELNFAVQVTIDRIIFLRMCEDRGIEPYGQLQKQLEHDGVYKGLLELFRLADHKYNSGLFHFEKEPQRDDPDGLTPDLKIDDKVLKGIIGGLYFPECPYEFSALPADILGQVYEQFLGKVIRLTAGHHAKVEDKPEVKKAGGVYYTPSYIVQYIVEQTVGKLLHIAPGLPGGRSDSTAGSPGKPGAIWNRAAKLRILDPACGSGSFLLGAFQYLIDWHRNWYEQDGPDQHKKELVALPGGGYRLSNSEKKRILVNNIYGVDIDPQAVEVTKLSLLLKVLEAETNATLFPKDRALPDLDRNIRCGNSLIGPDFYDGRLFPDEEERLRINAFDWQGAFPKIMKAGGFDAVIGNPPYIRMEEFKDLKMHLRDRFKTHDERSDFYVYFLERGHELLRPNGRFGMILSNKFIRANYGRGVRELLEPIAVETIVDLAGLPVFRGATVRTIVLLTRQAQRTASTWYSPPPTKDAFLAVESGSLALRDVVEQSGFAITADALKKENWFLARVEVRVLLAKLVAVGSPLIEKAGGIVGRGIVSGLTDAFVIDSEVRKEIVRKNPEAGGIIRPFVQGRDIGRYHLEPPGDYLIYTLHGIDMRKYPAVIGHLKPFKERLLARATEQEWYELQQPQANYVGHLEKPKIVFPDMAIAARFTLDTGGYFGANTVYFLPTDDRFLLGVLNSKTAQFYFSQTCAALEGAGESYLRFFGQYLEQFPVCQSTDKPRHDRIVTLVERMLTLHAQLAKAKVPALRAGLQSQIESTDREIDRIVYELYGLTEAEIRIVEGASGIASEPDE